VGVRMSMQFNTPTKVGCSTLRRWLLAGRKDVS
jgi:hypothetical protein